MRFMEQNSNNPFASPEHVDKPARVPVSFVLRCLSLVSFGSGFVAFMAYYGYPASIDQMWIFFLLPMQSVIACTFGLAALVVPWQPSSASKWSFSIFACGVAFPIACFGLTAVLSTILKYPGHGYHPRIILFFVATTTVWIAVQKVHGDIRGRRLTCIGYGFGVLQCYGSIIDFLYTQWSFD